MKDDTSRSDIPDNTAECKHNNVTLCQWQCDDGWFVAYQCDDCGWVTNQDAPADSLDAGQDLPQLDILMWEAAIERWLKRMIRPNDTLLNAVGFFARAKNGAR